MPNQKNRPEWVSVRSKWFRDHGNRELLGMIASLLSDIALPHTLLSTYEQDPWAEAYKATTAEALALADSEFKVRSLTIIADENNTEDVFYGPSETPSRVLSAGDEITIDIPPGAPIDLATWYILARNNATGQNVTLQYCR